MAEALTAKIKIVRSILEDFKKRLSKFPKIDKTFTESEIFLNLQITDLEDEYKKAKSLNSEIIGLGEVGVPEFDLYNSSKTFEAITNIYFKHSTTLHEFLKIVSKSDRHDLTFSEATQATFQRININPNETHPQSLFDVNMSYLPGSVPIFDGSYSKWADFMNDYVTNVHENSSLTKGSKLKILSSLLKGDAMKVVKREFGTLKITEYDAIWEKLTQRYNHKKSIVYAYFHELFFQPNLDKETATNLKSLYDITYDSVLALKNLGLQTDHWGDILLFLVYTKLPMKTKELWDEKHTKKDALPAWNDFLEFLEWRFRTLESLESAVKHSNNFSVRSSTNQKRFATFQTTTTENQSNSKVSCKCCQKGSHSLRKCYKFKKMKVQERVKLVKSLNYCLNCFSFSHDLSNCRSNFRCENCNDKHHTMLCLKPKTPSNSSDPIQSQNSVSESQSHVNKHIAAQNVASTSDGRFSRLDPSTYTSLVSEPRPSECTIFPTALVKVVNMETGISTVLRAMIDNCSDASYITENAVRRLKLPVQGTELQIAGLGNSPTAKTVGIVSFSIGSLNSDFCKPISAFVLSLISPSRPSQSFTLNENSLSSVVLADPFYNKRSRIDLLLGGAVDAAIHKDESFKLEQENLILRDTQLGWIVSGSISELNCFTSTISPNCSTAPTASSVNNIELTLKSLDDSLRLFWEIEELPNSRNLTSEERLCEHIYQNTTIRTSTGRYSVSLPFKSMTNGFQNMRNIALSRFTQLEKKLSKDSDLCKEYVDCMEEYIKLNHMTLVDPYKFPGGYYIPHHCVIKNSSTTTKLRVVFDASARDADLHSLNDCLMNGPRLQLDLLDHLLRFRTFKVAFTADIAKMYRQIEINPNDRKFQLILWRSNPSEEINTYCLNTVTFGTKSAPFLAVRTLLRLSEDECNRFPKGSLCLKNGFYVDDCIYGSDSVEEALEIQTELIGILGTASFHIRKWSSNYSTLLEGVPETDRETDTLRDFDSKVSVKTLGLQWCPNEDCFRYKIKFDSHMISTKRSILSEISKIFDPLGWISPCLITAKLLIQKLWIANMEWDSKVEGDLDEIWANLRNGLISLTEDFRVPRWLRTYRNSSVEIHGFSDASTKAYAIAIYVKTMTEGKVSTNLLCAKSKVAPLKTISLPRLELMGAVMLAKMVQHLKSVLAFSKAKYVYWCDSQITLAWIRDEPQKRVVFVANRVAEIQALCPSESWMYVETKSNPADLGTRGISPSDLINSSLWWNGPQFLKTFNETSPFQSDEKIILPQEDNIKPKSLKCPSDSFIQTFLSHRRTSISETASNLFNFSMSSLNKFSTLTRLVRVVAFCLRWRHRSDHSFITPSEYEQGLLTILRMVQGQVYAQEIEDIQSDGISKQSTIYSLNPFLNPIDKLLRVTGRLENADHINYDQKHPIILPYSHIVTKLIARHAHVSTLHGTEQQTLMLISQRYCIIKCKRLVKTVIHHCVKCFRMRCAVQNQLMGQLPTYRISPNRPFLNSGVDFAGPFDIKKYKGRCQTAYKSYFAIFVCFSTKAVHLEVVIDLSSSAFIAAYRRFISRRGICRNLYSDCGTNFIGSKDVITRSKSAVQNQWNEMMANDLSEFQTNWHYNPPGAPHFGGLWEAGVKSVKHHLKRIIGNTRLTYDEFETVLIQTEACLNSRPLCEIRNSSESLVITPAHFLIQDSLLALPDDNLASKNISQLDRWNMVQKITQNFWTIWSQEYLNTLCQRKKWKDRNKNLEVGNIVLLKERNLPPTSWLLAKVLDIYPGKDQLVRVVLLKTEKSEFKRPITKLCKLPLEEQSS